MREALSFDDVSLVPKFSEIETRSSVSLISRMYATNLPYTFRYPFISSPMDTVTEEEMLFQMAKYGGLGILHRYNSIEKQVEILKKASDRILEGQFAGWLGAAVGTTGDFIERAKELSKFAHVICIDVAHGHHSLVKKALEKLKYEIGPYVSYMVGNIATVEAYEDLVEWGADSIRVGIGSGAACSTRIKTGFGIPLFQSLLDIHHFKRGITNDEFIKKASKVAIIADGGIRSSGDAVKAFAAGADFVMLGGLLAGSKASPRGVMSTPDGRWMKLYRGMACYSEDTEILTKLGWKLFSSLRKEDKLATLNSNFELEYHQPDEIYKYNYNGEMYNIANQQIDLYVTPNHNLFIAKQTNNKYKPKYKIIQASEAYSKIHPNFLYKKDCIWKGKEENLFQIPDSNLTFEMDKWLDFYGFWLAEGCTYTYKQKNKYDVNITSFCNTDKDLFDKHVNILQDVGINVNIRIKKGKNKNCFEATVHKKELYDYLKQFGKSFEKFIDRNLLELSSRQLKILLKGIFDGDGNKSKNCINTTSKQLADDICEIMFKCGCAPKLSIARKAGLNYKSFKRNHDLYCINTNLESKVGNNLFVRKENAKLIKYDGEFVYCVNVKNHLVYVRRNNKSVWCGNSFDAQKEWGREKPAVEGVSTMVPYTGKVEITLDELKDGIKSGLSYVGASNIFEFQNKVEFVRQTNSGYAEGRPHILDKR